RHLLHEVPRCFDHRDRHAVGVGTLQIASERVKRAAVEPRQQREPAHRATARLRELVALAAIAESVLRHSRPRMQRSDTNVEGGRTGAAGATGQRYSEGRAAYLA